jgi:hypothetical protein
VWRYRHPERRRHLSSPRPTAAPRSTPTPLRILRLPAAATFWPG